MVGQINLITKLNNLTIDQFPKALILVGETGCGKHTFINEICNKYNCIVEDVITNYLTLETGTTERAEYLELVEEKVLTCTEHTLFMFDSSKQGIDFISIQNKVLKILEEQSNPFAHILFLGTSLAGLLPTIINRCVVWTFESYTTDELKVFQNQFVGQELYNIFNTPGKILSIKFDITTYLALAKQIFDCIDRAVISNILILPNKLSYSEDEVDKLNFDIFIDILKETAFQYYSQNLIGFDALILTETLAKNTRISSIDKKKLYERYLIELKDDIKRFKNGN